MGKSFRKQFAETYQTARAEQAAKQAKKKADRTKEGPFVRRLADGIVRWGKRLFYTGFMGMAVYLVVMLCTLMLPVFLATIISAMGYTLANPAEILLTLFCGIFFTLWLFVISFVVVRYFGKIYLRAMKKTAKDIKEL